MFLDHYRTLTRPMAVGRLGVVSVLRHVAASDLCR